MGADGTYVKVKFTGDPSTGRPRVFAEMVPEARPLQSHKVTTSEHHTPSGHVCAYTQENMSNTQRLVGASQVCLVRGIPVA
jgi:hypothetical protein